MIAADTNVVVRFLVGDDPAQNRRARNLFEKSPVFLSATVLLETEWVLRGAYRIGPAEVLALLKGVLGLPSVECEEPDRIMRALSWYERGLDFADALHLASMGPARSFASFDAKLKRRAHRLGAPQVVSP